MMPAPESVYTVHPDVVSQAIKILAGAVLLLGSSLVGTLLYIWHKSDGRISKVESKIDRIATSMESLDKTLTVKITAVEGQVKAIQEVCKERAASCPGGHHHNRITDTRA
jgi:hypothetical protein